MLVKVSLHLLPFQPNQQPNNQSSIKQLNNHPSNQQLNNHLNNSQSPINQPHNQFNNFQQHNQGVKFVLLHRQTMEWSLFLLVDSLNAEDSKSIHQDHRLFILKSRMFQKN